MMPEETARRLIRVEADRETKTGVPSYPPPGLMPAAAALIERLTAELAKSRKPRRAKG